MGIKEVTELRKQAKLQEAYNMAIADLEHDSSNIYNQRSIAWVYFEYLKINAVADKYEKFIAILDKIVELKMPESEKLFFDYASGQVVKLIFNMIKAEKVNIKKQADEGFVFNSFSNTFVANIEVLFQRIQHFHFSKPSESYTYLLRAFHSALKESPQYTAFIEFWDLKNLQPADFEPQELPNGTKTLSFGESVVIAYLKLILNQRLAETESENRTIRKQKIEDILPIIESIDRQYPTLQFISYYRAKLLIELGDTVNVLSAFLPFAIRKRNNFWVWDLLSDLYPVDNEKHLACLCKALTIDTPEEMLIKLRQKTAKILVEKKLFNEAKNEIAKCIETRQKHQWKIPSEVENWTKSEWFATATMPENNWHFYKKYASIAEDVLYQNNPEIAVVIEFINTDKKILYYVGNEENHGFFNYEKLLKNPKIGNILLIRIDKREETGRTKVITARIAPNGTSCEALQSFEGTLNIPQDKNFGLVANIFFPPQFIVQNQLKNGQYVKGLSLLSFNKTKGVWGRKVLSMDV